LLYKLRLWFFTCHVVKISEGLQALNFAMIPWWFQGGVLFHCIGKCLLRIYRDVDMLRLRTCLQ